MFGKNRQEKIRVGWVERVEKFDPTSQTHLKSDMTSYIQRTH